MPDDAIRSIQGGPAQPVFIVNAALPASSAPAAGNQATTVANGANVVEGSTTDAAVSTDANGTLSAKLRGLIVLVVNLLSRWPAALTAAGSLKVGGGAMATANVTLTRPADTSVYAAKDAVANSTSAPTVLTFAAMAAANAGSGYITKARMQTDQSTFVTRFRLHLYHTAPTAINDNAQFALLFANAANRIGYIDFDSASTAGTGSTSAQSLNATVRLPFICAAGSQALYGLLETLDAFTPASGQQVFIELTADQNQ